MPDCRVNIAAAAGKVLCAACLLIILVLPNAFAQTDEISTESKPERSLAATVDIISDMTYKETMLRQELFNVVMSPERFLRLGTQGYTQSFTETGAVINTIGSEVICVVDGRYLVKETRLDTDTNDVYVDLRLDDQHANIICSNFSESLSSTQCSIRQEARSIDFVGDHLNYFRETCIEQMKQLIEGDEPSLAVRLAPSEG